MPDATPPDPPSRLKRLENLLRELLDPGQLRRLVANVFGTRVTSQLPEACSHELLAHGTVTVLERNGMITDELFVELVGERPRKRTMIEEVAREHGIVNLPPTPPTSPGSSSRRRRRVQPAGAPDFLVRDIYRSLRRQHTLLRKLTHGDLHFARLFDIAIRMQSTALKNLPRKVVSWIEKNHHQFTLREVSASLTAVRTIASLFSVSPEAGLISSFVGLSTKEGRNAVAQLVNFADLSDQDLYRLALKMVETVQA
jgi:hypothetical protein